MSALCDCERGHNGLGLAGRECDCPTGAWPELKVVNPDIGEETGVPYLDCLLHRILDAQQDINRVANERMDQSLCDASALLDEVEAAIRKLAAPSDAEPSSQSSLEASGGSNG